MKPLRAAHLTVLCAVTALTLGGCGSSSDGSAGAGASDTSSAPASASASASGSPSASASSGQCSYPDDTVVPQAARKVSKPPATPAFSGKVDVTITTNQGAIPFVLDADNAPCTVNAVLSLAKQGFYTNSPCSRVAYQSAGFAILQCGDPTGTGSGGPGYVYDEEVTGKETYTKGVIAMAKRSDPGSTSSQFFIMFGDTRLPPEYTVLGKVAGAKGLAVIEKAAKVALKGTSDGYDGKPASPIVIRSITTTDG